MNYHWLDTAQWLLIVFVTAGIISYRAAQWLTNKGQSNSVKSAIFAISVLAGLSFFWLAWMNMIASWFVMPGVMLLGSVCQNCGEVASKRYKPE